uniref:Secreted protein n=1 Tax=Parastrongyloides trichosuri TaxID=131310 RepID=A0A0N4ZIU9_PARTI
MKFFLLVVALLGYAANTSAQMSNAKCVGLLTTAQQAFNAKLGIPSTLDWHQPELLRNTVESQYVLNQYYGLRDVCLALKAYKSAFPWDQQTYAYCFDAARLIVDDNGQSTGVTVLQAKNYVGFISAVEYACGAGYNLFANQAQCISSAFSNQNTTIQNCRTAFVNQISADPNNLCDYTYNLDICYLMAFQECGLEGQFFGCEYSRNAISASYQQCQNNMCFVNRPRE